IWWLSSLSQDLRAERGHRLEHPHQRNAAPGLLHPQISGADVRATTSTIEPDVAAFNASGWPSDGENTKRINNSADGCSVVHSPSSRRIQTKQRSPRSAERGGLHDCRQPKRERATAPQTAVTERGSVLVGWTRTR